MINYKELVSKMTLEEKASLLSGKDIWQTKNIERLGLASIFLSDGPHGVRKQLGEGDHLGLNESVKATCFPTAATVANSWDTELGELVGASIGEEAFVQDVDVLLGPGLNMKRSPLCGRNFEYFSEDPYLAGKMAAGYVKGIQSQGVSACPKHFAVNSQELRRMANDSIVDERTLREIYLTAFEIVVKEAKPKSIMSAYNRINGVYASEHEQLLQNILVDEWGFDGFVVTDWGGSNDHVESVRNGNHLEMPTTGGDSDRELVEAVKSGRLSEELLDKRVGKLLEVIYELHTNKEQSKKTTLDVLEHHKIAQKVALESIVLLKNEDEILPLRKGANVAVIGDFAETPRYQGAGSSIVNCTRLDSTLDVIKESGFNMVGFATGYHRNSDVDHAAQNAAIELAKKADVVLYYIGLDEISESEGLDRTSMKIPENQITLLSALAKVNKNIVAVISAGSSIEMPWVNHCKAIVHGYLSGQAGAGAILKVISGEACPSGKLAETYPLKLEDSPTYNYFPGKEYNSEYRESLYIGYRYYDTVNQAVQFPFGYGLSYTSFEYSEISVNDKEATFTITNTGKVDGAEVAQMYVSAKCQGVFRPKKELKGFTKVFLKAGESKQVRIELDDKAFRYYNVMTKSWEVEQGEYEILIGASSMDIRLSASMKVAGTNATLPYNKAEMKSYYSGQIKDVDDKEFEALLGHTIPDGRWDERGLLNVNDALCQMYYAKSALARLVYKILTRIKNRSEAKGKPNLNVLFIYNMPFRGIAKMTNGAITMEMANCLVEMVNGHFFRGFRKLVKAYFKNRKAQKSAK
ncbi:glycoside hydrolase family 3 C-terminal domain-containing protein [Anaeromicropila herbilytica]|uniref:Glycosyl hydrolase n=1 Tax=Anaeromicropila herbilytica TaxID=2785025 RepID=A0A7R7IB62_9FIRM|nr:glycoside hydrolase family 3 C-terminal domain-containing protein [Anaeromicropila herbilytica]BCN29197.1 glycosyl hydrolase [Anaeromicropila herbilytica]